MEKQEFRRPTDIQFKAIPHIMKGEDVLAIAQTGTGKTAAYVIPVLDKVHRGKLKQVRKDGIKCIVMVPTHELALQVVQVFRSIGKFTRVKCHAVIGGVEQDPQIQQLNSGFDVLVATPGRMFDLIAQGHLRTNRVETLILDEADHMLDLGFISDIKDLIKKIPKRRQTLFFSATINDKIKRLAYSLVVNPIRITLSPKNPVTKNVNHSLMFVEMDDKRFFLERLVRENPESKILVFARTKVRSERISKAMERADIPSLVIHGDKEQKERNKVMADFKSGRVKMLIATDVSARGIDIPDVNYVVNYDMPEQAENYVHRIGRTGRGKKKGFAYSFVAPHEKELLENIQAFLGSEIEIRELDKTAYKETLEVKFEQKNDWKSLLGEIEENEERERKKKKRRK